MKTGITEDKQDVVAMDVPLLIRILELAREEIKDDVELHRVVERMLKIGNGGVLTMASYEFIAGKKAEMSKSEPELGDIKRLAGLR